MSSSWEYARVSEGARISENEGGSPAMALSLAEEAWQVKLNELGETGWELVSEQLRQGGSGPPSDPFWAEFSGTMKRTKSAAS
jgi:hypothetical protein